MPRATTAIDEIPGCLALPAVHCRGRCSAAVNCQIGFALPSFYEEIIMFLLAVDGL